MHLKKIILLALVLMSSHGINLYAEEDRFRVDGKVLQTICTTAMRELTSEDVKNEEDKTSILVDVYSCIYYVIGATDGFYAVAKRNTDEKQAEPKPPFCVPDDVTNSMGLQTILDYLKAHPAALKEKGALAILQAMQEKYPCH